MINIVGVLMIIFPVVFIDEALKEKNSCNEKFMFASTEEMAKIQLTELVTESLYQWLEQKTMIILVHSR